MSDLKASLLKVEGSPEGTRYYRNPEGPQAWDRIQSLEDDLEKAREALETAKRRLMAADDFRGAELAAQTLSALEGK